MYRARWALLLLYVAALLLSLPYTPPFVRWAGARIGPAAVVSAAATALIVPAALAVRRLARARAVFPWPQLALVAIGVAAGAAWRLCASSPVGRVHLPEYGLLALLAGRAFGRGTRAVLGGGATGAAVGLADELVQAVTPGRVFDWWDVALNAAASLLGALWLAWWRWTSKQPAEGKPCENQY